jgi:hypothetical protein
MTDPSELGGFDPSLRASDFFRDAVETVIEKEGYEATTATQVYVTTLLVDYARPTALAGQLLSEPVGIALAKALHVSTPDRFERLRTLGDEVLFISGFFTEYLQKRGLESGYARELGAVAYDGASQTLRRLGGSQDGPDVFGELSTNFSMFVELLTAVADMLYARSVASPGSLLELYERWRRSGSHVLSDALSQHGVTPLRGDRTIH